MILRLEGDSRVLWAQHLLTEARREEASHQVARAEAAYAELDSVDFRGPYYNLGQLFLALDEPVKARTFFERFLILEPEGDRATMVLHLLVNMGAAP